MTQWPNYGRIEGAIVMIGFGSIGRGTLPLIERHFDFDTQPFRRHRPRRFRSRAARRARHQVRASGDHARQLSRGARPLSEGRRRPGLLRQSLGRHLLARPHALLPRDRRALYRHRRRAVAGLLFRQVARATRRAPTTRCARPCSPSAAPTPAASPPSPAAAPIPAWCPGSSSRRWSISPPISATPRRSRRPASNGAQLAQRLGVKGVHIAERDTQRAKQPKPRDVFVNTWSVEGFLSEGMQPAELGWGTHEKWAPANAGFHKEGCGAAIYLLQPGANTRVRSWTPTREGAIRLPRHPQRVDLDRRLFHAARRQGRGGLPPDLPLRLSPLRRRGAEPARIVRPRRQDAAGATTSSTEDEIVDGIDELGVLLYGHAKNAYWYGSQLSVEETRALAPYQNATGMQVTSAVLAGMVWALENPNAGIVEADEMDYHRCLRSADALSRPGGRRLHRLDAADRPARPVSRGHRRQRSLAVPQRAGQVSASDEATLRLHRLRPLALYRPRAALRSGDAARGNPATPRVVVYTDKPRRLRGPASRRDAARRSATISTRWTRAGAYNHRIKPCVLIDALAAYGGLCALLDTDSYIAAGLRRRARRAPPPPGRRWIISSAATPIPRSPAGARELPHLAATSTIRRRAIMCNSGLIAARTPRDGAALEDALALIDALWDAGRRLFKIEQIASARRSAATACRSARRGRRSSIISAAASSATCTGASTPGCGARRRSRRRGRASPIPATPCAPSTSSTALIPRY